MLEVIKFARTIKLLDKNKRFMIMFKYADSETWSLALPVKNMYLKTELEAMAEIKLMEKDPIIIKYKCKFKLSEIIENCK